MTRSHSTHTRRHTLPVAGIILVVLVAVLVLRRGADTGETDPKPDGLNYVERARPLLAAGEQMAAHLSTTSALPQTLAEAAELQSRWAEVRTSPGYVRAQHDGFILTFNQFFNLLRAAEIIVSVSHTDGSDSIPEDHRTEILFALQTIHGTETSAQLVAKTQLSIDLLLTGTNLARDLAVGLEKAAITCAKARQVFDELSPPAGL